jgi:hypothetical protein
VSLARHLQRNRAFVGAFRSGGLVLEVVRNASGGRDLFGYEITWTIVAEQLAIDARARPY